MAKAWTASLIAAPAGTVTSGQAPQSSGASRPGPVDSRAIMTPATMIDTLLMIRKIEKSTSAAQLPLESVS